MEADMAVKSFTNWEVLYFIANYVLAAIAIIGFWASSRTSGKVQESLETIKKSFISFSEPLIRVSNTSWVFTGDGTSDGTKQASVHNPPKGILVHYVNASRVPIQITATKLDVYYGEKILDDVITKTTHCEDGMRILAPGESNFNGTVQPVLFEKYLGTPKDSFTPPHLNFLLHIEFQNMDGLKFVYTIKQEVMFEIETNNTIGRTIYESLRKTT